MIKVYDQRGLLQLLLLFMQEVTYEVTANLRHPYTLHPLYMYTK